MKPKTLLALFALALLTVACNLERILDPSLPTQTPVPTWSADITSAPTSSPTPSPSPTPAPDVRIHSGDQALLNGDWETALAEYDSALQSSTDPELQSAALLGLGRAYYGARQYASALDTLRRLINDYPNSSQLAHAHFALGLTYQALERYTEAAQAYQSYLDLRPGVIDSYVLERRGDVLTLAGQVQAAIGAYQSAGQAPRLDDGTLVKVKIGEAYALSGQLENAIVTFQEVYNLTSNDYIKAQMDYSLGQAYVVLGQTELAYSVYLEAVENYPLAYYSYLSLVELVNAGYPVSDFDRGLIDYFAGQYGVALTAFDRHQVDFPDDQPDTVLYYSGLAQRTLEFYDQAIAEWDQLISNYHFTRFWDSAYEQKAYTQWFYLGQYEAAIETLLGFVEDFPDQPRAAEFLFDAGRIAEIGGDLESAYQIWGRLGLEFPTSEYAFDGVFLSGITRYRQSIFDQALNQFRSASVLANDPSDQAAAYLWLGKASASLGDTGAAQTAWQQAQASDPTGYYSERAADLLAGRAAFEAPADFDLSFDLEAERVAAETWLRTTFALGAEVDLSGPGPLSSDPRFQRGTELWSLGLYEDARSEFESLRLEVQSDPANSYRLANYLIELGLYRSGVIAARQVLNLAGMDDAATMSAPPYFNHLRFGPYYQELVLPIAEDYGFHPLLLFSILRQESLFEGFITSTVGARGLMQVLPSTAPEILARTNWPPDYTADDLYRPIVSITFGADYLSTWRNYFGGDLYVALAAYNGGPGNADAWLALAGDDPDLFLEVIRYPETHDYIRGIYELYTIYRDVYGVTP